MIWLAMVISAFVGALLLFALLVTSHAFLLWVDALSMDWHLWMWAEMHGTREDLDLLSAVVSQGSLFLIGPGRYGFSLPQRQALRQFLEHMPGRVNVP